MSRTPPLRPPELGAAPLQVLIVAQDPLVRAGLAALLEVQEGLAVVREPAEADVVLWDAGLAPDEELVRPGAAGDPELPVLALVADVARSAAALAAGARGAVLRSADGAALWAALVAVRAGFTVLESDAVPPAVAPEPPPEARPGRAAGIQDLTAREREVLALLSRGMSNRHIARALDISEHTAKFHASAILSKLGAATRTEAVVIAARHGLVTL